MSTPSHNDIIHFGTLTHFPREPLLKKSRSSRLLSWFGQVVGKVRSRSSGDLRTRRRDSDTTAADWVYIPVDRWTNNSVNYAAEKPNHHALGENVCTDVGDSEQNHKETTQLQSETTSMSMTAKSQLGLTHINRNEHYQNGSMLISPSGSTKHSQQLDLATGSEYHSDNASHRHAVDSAPLGAWCYRRPRSRTEAANQRQRRNQAEDGPDEITFSRRSVGVSGQYFHSGHSANCLDILRQMSAVNEYEDEQSGEKNCARRGTSVRSSSSDGSLSTFKSTTNQPRQLTDGKQLPFNQVDLPTRKSQSFHASNNKQNECRQPVNPISSDQKAAGKFKVDSACSATGDIYETCGDHKGKQLRNKIILDAIPESDDNWSTLRIHEPQNIYTCVSFDSSTATLHDKCLHSSPVFSAEKGDRTNLISRKAVSKGIIESAKNTSGSFVCNPGNHQHAANRRSKQKSAHNVDEFDENAKRKHNIEFFLSSTEETRSDARNLKLPNDGWRTSNFNENFQFSMNDMRNCYDPVRSAENIMEVVPNTVRDLKCFLDIADRSMRYRSRFPSDKHLVYSSKHSSRKFEVRPRRVRHRRSRKNLDLLHAKGQIAKLSNITESDNVASKDTGKAMLSPTNASDPHDALDCDKYAVRTRNRALRIICQPSDSDADADDEADVSPTLEWENHKLFHQRMPVLGEKRKAVTWPRFCPDSSSMSAGRECVALFSTNERRPLAESTPTKTNNSFNKKHSQRALIYHGQEKGACNCKENDLSQRHITRNSRGSTESNLYSQELPLFASVNLYTRVDPVSSKASRMKETSFGMNATAGNRSSEDSQDERLVARVQPLVDRQKYCHVDSASSRSARGKFERCLKMRSIIFSNTLTGHYKLSPAEKARIRRKLPPDDNYN